MTTPSKPLAIGPRSPRLQGDDAEENANSRPPATGTPLQPTLLNQQLLEPTTRVGTPLSSTPIDLRALRAQYAAAAGGTPPPNIPLRPVPIGATPATATPLSQQLFEASIASSSPRVGPTFALGVGGLNQRRPGTPTVGTPGASASPYVGSYASSGVATPIGLGIAGPSDASVQQPVINLEDLPDEEKARVLRRHLVSKEERVAALAKDRPESVAGSDHVPADGASGSEQPQQKPLGLIAQLRKSLGGGKVENETTLAAGPSTTDRSRRSSAAGSSSNVHTKHDTEPFPIPYHAPGADITHDIYKWQSDQRKAARARALSYSGPPGQRSVHPSFGHIHEPGGFRRNYVMMRAGDSDAASDVAVGNGQDKRMVPNNFIEFLYLFGHFAGEDLEEDLDEDKPEDEEEQDEEARQIDRGFDPSSSTLVSPARQLSTGLSDVITIPKAVDEETPLLAGTSALTSRTGRAISKSKRRRAASTGPHGNATVTQAVLMLLKSFVGTGVLFLGRAFYNGGLLFSAVTFVFIATISLYSFLLLVRTKFVVSGSFGDIGGTLYGPWMRYLILGSIVVSQVGFVAAYTIFVAQNLQAFVLAVTDCAKVYSAQFFIVLQLAVFLPLALIRDLAKLSTTALVADAFILVGLVYIFSSEASILIEKGVAADVKLWNERDFPLFIGTAVFSFEGIGLVIPITDAMREPRKFPMVLTGVMIFLTLLFGGAGILAYVTFGSDVQAVVLLNLDSTSPVLQGVQFVYAIAILLSAPLQLFPAVRILENGLFTRSGKGDPKVKWTKNVFRFAMVGICTTISWLGAADLDKFVAFIGCFACVPLCYVYPAMLHYKAVAKTRNEKMADWAMIIFGLLVAAYTTVQTIKLMLEPQADTPPVFGHCDVPQS